MWLSEARLQYANRHEGRETAESRESAAVRLAVLRHFARSSGAQLRLDVLPARPIERRIYEVARSTCVEGEELAVDLATFHLQIGFQSQMSNFRAAMRKIVSAASIPDYHVKPIEKAA